MLDLAYKFICCLAVAWLAIVMVGILLNALFDDGK